MGNKKNIEFDKNDPVIEAVMEVILNPYFNGLSIRTATAKGNHLEKKYKQYGFKLKFAGSQLTKNLFIPFERNKVCNLSFNYCQRLFELLQKLRTMEDVPDPDDIIFTFKELYEEKYDANKIIVTDEIIWKFWERKCDTPELFDTEWWVYERIGSSPSKGLPWGIAVGTISFKQKGKFLEAKVTFKYDTPGEKKYKLRHDIGIVTHDNNKDYLYIDLIVSDNTMKRSNMVLRKAEVNVDEQDIMLGHYNYHSTSYSHLLSKTIILQKKEMNSDIVIGDYYENTAEYKKIPQPIRQFLYTREMNRMSLPHRRVSNIDELEQFLTTNKEDKLSNRLKSFFCIDYYVYYINEENSLTEDELTIFKNEEAITVDGKYTHYIDNEKKIKKIWSGKAYTNKKNNNIILELSNEKVLNDDDENPILLTFLFSEVVAYESSECFPGILTGLKDTAKGSVSYAVLVVKVNTPGFERQNDARLYNYFNKHPHLQLTTINDHFKL